MERQNKQELAGSAGRFFIVGSLSAFVHITCGILLIQAGMHPLLANVFAFLIAFSGGFLGHHFYSFKGHGRTIFATFIRFFPVAIASFALNELILAGLLKLDWFAPTIALAISSLSVAVFSFLLGRFWAFRQS